MKKRKQRHIRSSGILAITILHLYTGITQVNIRDQFRHCSRDSSLSGERTKTAWQPGTILFRHVSFSSLFCLLSPLSKDETNRRQADAHLCNSCKCNVVIVDILVNLLTDQRSSG